MATSHQDLAVGIDIDRIHEVGCALKTGGVATIIRFVDFHLFVIAESYLVFTFRYITNGRNLLVKVANGAYLITAASISDLDYVVHTAGGQ